MFRIINLATISLENARNGINALLDLRLISDAIATTGIDGTIWILINQLFKLMIHLWGKTAATWAMNRNCDRRKDHQADQVQIERKKWMTWT